MPRRSSTGIWSASRPRKRFWPTLHSSKHAWPSVQERISELEHFVHRGNAEAIGAWQAVGRGVAAVQLLQA
eukprot:3417347-Prorocentrum_lima.AAC.1